MLMTERGALRIRRLLAALWLLVILSLLHDPFTPALTVPGSPLPALDRAAQQCVVVQNHCVSSFGYAIGAPLFWGLMLPVLIGVIFLFGHELWRRVCPLSYFSQLARRHGWVRRPAADPSRRGGPTKPIRLRSDSWLARHHHSVQFGLLYLALCCRILLVNADRLSLALFLASFILAAVVVGFLYDGKTWCQYLCPVAPVEEFFTGPRGLLGSVAHIKHHSKRKVSQSMCRTIADAAAAEKSDCVGCISNCIDIDAEKAYWSSLMEPRKQRLYYGYAGLVVAYFFSYFLYAGNWWYYLSGIWAHEPDEHASLLKSGLYLMGHSLPLPRLLAVPLVLGVGALLGYAVGRFTEKQVWVWLRPRRNDLNRNMLRHHLFTLTTLATFNIFFLFAGHNVLYMLPRLLQVYIPALLCALSAIWFYRTWHRHPDDYRAEATGHQLDRRRSSRLVSG